MSKYYHINNMLKAKHNINRMKLIKKLVIRRCKRFSAGSTFCPPGDIFDPIDLYHAVCLMTDNLISCTLTAYNDSTHFLRANINILVINSDKGQITILIQDEYEAKLNNFMTVNIGNGTYLPYAVGDFLKEYHNELVKMNELIFNDIYVDPVEKAKLCAAINCKSTSISMFL